jgi:hypothetical protein
LLTRIALLVLVLFLCFLCGCGGTSHSNVVTAPPSIISLSPTSGVAGASVTITGSNFGSSNVGSSAGSVTFNGKTAAVATWSSSSIVAKVPSGATTGSVIVTVDGTASNGVPFTVVTLPAGSIAASNFGMQCGIGTPIDGHINCNGSGSTPIVWPATQAQPGMLRLHDAGTYWAELNPSDGTYDFSTLDNWLDLIAQNQPVAVSQVFAWTPCWDSTTGTGPLPGGCGIAADAPTGTNGYPNDLKVSGSPSFNAFVTALVQHCSPAGNCVANEIKYYEMWNEWDLSFHWTGTMAQVYQMVAPAVTIIRNNVPGAVILMPSSTPDSDTGLGYLTDFQNWLSYEDAHPPHISDWIDWHVYLASGETTTATPEDQWSAYDANYLSVQASNPNWVDAPWADTETNFNGSTQVNYQCPSAQYNAQDCTGQIVRWQLLHNSNGSSGVLWYYWLNTIGSNPQYDTAYYYMMQYLVGGTFSSPCSFTAANGASTWTCDFTEANGTVALWVWTPSEAGTTFTVPAGFTDYRDLSGGTTTVTPGQTINIGTEPFMLEQ